MPFSGWRCSAARACQSRARGIALPSTANYLLLRGSIATRKHTTPMTRHMAYVKTVCVFVHVQPTVEKKKKNEEREKEKENKRGGDGTSLKVVPLSVSLGLSNESIY